MAITFVGASAAAADNTYCDDQASFDDVAYVGGSAANDLLFVLEGEKTYPGVFTNTAAGSQTWNAFTAHEDNTVVAVYRAFWAQYNGAGSTPNFTPGHPDDFNDRLGIMLGFRPTAGFNWQIDVAEAAVTYTAPVAPYDVAISGQSATTSAVHIAWWLSSGGIPTATLQTVGWTSAGTWRCGANNTLALSMAYKIVASAGASGSVTNRFSAGFPGICGMVTFKEVAAGAKSLPRVAFPQILMSA